jgi:hypothetical protein
MNRSTQFLSCLVGLAMCMPAYCQAAKGNTGSSNQATKDNNGSGTGKPTPSGSADLPNGGATDTPSLPERVVPVLLSGVDPLAKVIADRINKAGNKCAAILPFSPSDYFSAKARVELYDQIVHTFPPNSISSDSSGTLAVSPLFTAAITTDITSISSVLDLGVSIVKMFHSDSTIASGPATTIKDIAFQRALLHKITGSVTTFVPITGEDARSAATVIVALSAQDKKSALAKILSEAPPRTIEPIAPPSPPDGGAKIDVNTPVAGAASVNGIPEMGPQQQAALAEAVKGLEAQLKAKPAPKPVAKKPPAPAHPNPAPAAPASPNDAGSSGDAGSILQLVTAIANDYALVRFVEQPSSERGDGGKLPMCFLAVSLDYQGGAAITKTSLFSNAKGADLGFLSASFELDSPQGIDVDSSMVNFVCKAPSVFMNPEGTPTKPQCGEWVSSEMASPPATQ